MRREDIIDSLEYIDDEYIEEADRTRNAERPAGDPGKVIPFRRRPAPARRWGTLVAGLAVLVVAAVAVTGILRLRSGSVSSMQSAEAVIEEDRTETYEMEGAAEAPEGSAAEDMADMAEAAAEVPEEYAVEEMPAAAAEEAAAEEMPAAAAEEYAADEKAAASAPEEAVGEAEQAYETEETEAAAKGPVRICVTSDAGEVVFVLNDTPAAESFAAQLPLSVDTELYGGNEIVFHPEEPLDIENGMEGGGTAGYIGYFAPWNNIVLYYGDFDAYPGLYILGEAVSGAENIRDIRGRVTVERR